MGTVSAQIAASPEQVFAVLADGWLYSDWVVGTSHVRAVEGHWPEPGSRLHHATGAWPLVFRDETKVESSEPGRRLLLTARGRPLGEATVDISLRPHDGGTTVALTETPCAGPVAWLHNPVTEVVLRRRNVETLARLAALVERRTEA